MAHHGIPVLIDARHEIAHNKIMIIDDETVITGSFNFTRQADEHNAENLLVIHDHGMADTYLANWHGHEAHSQPYVARGEEAQRPTNERNGRTKKKAGILDRLTHGTALLRTGTLDLRRLVPLRWAGPWAVS